VAHRRRSRRVPVVMLRQATRRLVTKGQDELHARTGRTQRPGAQPARGAARQARTVRMVRHRHLSVHSISERSDYSYPSR
jgi:hypothetical protein